MTNSKVSTKIKKLESWETKKEVLSEKAIQEKRKVNYRIAIQGSIYITQFGENIGDEINKNRLSIVISNDKINKKSSCVTVLPLTKTLKFNKKGNKPKYSFHYFLFKYNYPFLNYNSAVKCEQIRSISKARIIKYLGDVNETDLKKIINKVKGYVDI